MMSRWIFVREKSMPLLERMEREKSTLIKSNRRGRSPQFRPDYREWGGA